MATAKDEVLKMLEKLPDESSFEDIQYHIYVREKIERGLKDVKEGRVLSQGEVERRVAKALGTRRPTDAEGLGKGEASIQIDS